MSEQKFFFTERFGPISTGHIPRSVWGNYQRVDDKRCSYTRGYGRIVKITFGADELDNDAQVVSHDDLQTINEWLEKEWSHRILLAADDPLLDDFKTLHELGGVNINIMPEGYGPGIELSCKYVHDHVQPLSQALTSGRCWVQLVEIWEHERNSAIHGQFPN